jgi:hypothetical protein
MFGDKKGLNKVPAPGGQSWGKEKEMYGVFSKNGNQLYVFKNETEAKRYTESAPASRIYLGFLYSPINPEIAECGKTAWL